MKPGWSSIVDASTMYARIISSTASYTPTQNQRVPELTSYRASALAMGIDPWWDAEITGVRVPGVPEYCEVHKAWEHGLLAKEHMQLAAELAERDWNLKMSSINACDRCDAFAMGAAMGAVDLYLGPTSEHDRKELCPGCVEEIDNFISMPVQNREGKAYRKPYTRPSNEPSADDLILKAAEKIVLGAKEIEGRSNE